MPASPVDWFDDNTMLDPLRKILRKKQARCRTLKTDCDEMHLVIAHDQAIPYCSPVTTLNRAARDIASEAVVAELSIDRGPFSRVSLLRAGEPCQVHRLL